MAFQFFSSQTQPALTSPKSLVGFLRDQTEKTVRTCGWDYCRARAGTRWPELIADPAFADAMEQVKRVGRAVILEDLLTLVFMALVRSSHGIDGASLGHSLLRIGRDAGLNAERESVVRRRLADSFLPTVPPMATIAKASGRMIFNALPKHPLVSAYDPGLIINNVGFAHHRSMQLFTTQFDAPFLAQQLLIQGDVPPGLDSETGMDTAGAEAAKASNPS